MDNSAIREPLFREAVEAIDSGNIDLLRRLLEENPELVSKRLDAPDEGYFAHPYLLWFVAGNPIRHEKLPGNIVAITALLIQFVKKFARESFQEQINYTLGLVATGSIPRESGVQIEWMDLLIDEGAIPGNAHSALAHDNKEAARHLIKRGGELTFTAAVCLDQKDEISGLAKKATPEDKQIALMAAAFYGNAEMIRYILSLGVDVNKYLDRSSGFHSHASALHQAVYSGSLESVKILVEAGADLAAKDRVYDGTPLGWAKYLQTQEKNETRKKNYAEIEAFLVNNNNTKKNFK
jgi:peptide-methionine (S)-S-oxide reductase